MSLRIGFLGSQVRIKSIQSIVQTVFPDIDPVYLVENLAMYEESVAEKLKSLKSTVDAFIFSGELQHEFYRYLFSPSLPCEYLRKDWSSLQNALLKASMLGIDFRQVSIDSYTRSSLQQVINDLEIPPEANHIQFIKRRRFHGDYIEKVIHEHLHYYRSGQVQGCVTALHPVYQQLLRESVPCVYVIPTTETIIKTIQNVMAQLDLKRTQTGHTAMLMIKVVPKSDYSYIRKDEYLNMHEKMKVAEEIFYFARNTKAAVVSDSSDEFKLLMSKSDLLEYSQGFQCFYLIHSIYANTNCDINIGIGYGFDPSEAKHNANIAVDRIDPTQKNVIYIVPKEGSLIGPLHFLHEEPHNNTRIEESHISALSNETGISQTLLYNLYALMEKQHQKTFTALSLSKNLALSQRSTNRLLLKLQEHHYATFVGKHLTGKSGRPSDVYEISLIP